LDGGFFIRRFTQIYADFFWGIAADFPITVPCQVVLAMQSDSSVTAMMAQASNKKSTPVSLPKNLRKSADKKSPFFGG
jgi:hypothetical protein